MIQGKVKDACGCFHTDTTEARQTIEDLEHLGTERWCMYVYVFIYNRKIYIYTVIYIYIYTHSFHIFKLMAEMSSVLGTVALDLHLTLRWVETTWTRMAGVSKAAGGNFFGDTAAMMKVTLYGCGSKSLNPKQQICDSCGVLLVALILSRHISSWIHHWSYHGIFGTMNCIGPK